VEVSRDGLTKNAHRPPSSGPWERELPGKAERPGEVETAIKTDGAAVLAEEAPVGGHHRDARSAKDFRFEPRHRVVRGIGGGRLRREPGARVGLRREEGIGEPASSPERLGAEMDVPDAARVERPDPLLVLLRPFEKEGTLFGNAELEAGEVHLLLVGLDDGEIGIHRGVHQVPRSRGEAELGPRLVAGIDSVLVLGESVGNHFVFPPGGAEVEPGEGSVLRDAEAILEGSRPEARFQQAPCGAPEIEAPGLPLTGGEPQDHQGYRDLGAPPAVDPRRRRVPGGVPVVVHHPAVIGHPAVLLSAERVRGKE